jgi:hypothetical protein
MPKTGVFLWFSIFLMDSLVLTLFHEKTKKQILNLKLSAMKTINKYGKSKFLVIVWAAMLIACSTYVHEGYGQLAPANFDGAPVLDPGQMETSLFVTGTYVSHKDMDGTYIKGYIPGIKLGFGIAKHFDLKLAYTRGIYAYKFMDWSDWEDSKVNNITLIPKVSFLNGILAVKIPASISFYHNDYNYEDKTKVNYLISPRVIASLHIKQIVEFSLSPFCDIFIPGEEGDPTYFVGGNLGFAFSTNLKRWAVRPEAFLSYQIPQGDNDTGSTIFGWGLSANFNFDLFTKK